MNCFAKPKDWISLLCSPLILTAVLLTISIAIDSNGQSLDEKRNYPAGSYLAVHMGIQLCGVAICIPLFLSCIIERLLLGRMFNDNDQRLTLICIIAIPNLIAYILCIIRFERLLVVVNLFNYLQLGVMLRSVFSLACGMFPNSLLYRLQNITLVSYFILSVLGTVDYTIDSSISNDSNSGYYARLELGFSIVCLITIGTFFFQLFRLVHSNKWNDDYLFLILYSVLVIIWALVLEVAQSVSPRRSMFTFSASCICLLVFAFPIALLRLAFLFSSTLKLQQQRNFMIRYISHEVRSPLNIIVGGINLLRGDLLASKESNISVTSLVEKVSYLVDSIEISALSACDAMSDILNFESLNEGLYKVDMDYFPVTHLCCEKNTQVFSMFAKNKDIEFRTAIESPEVPENICLLGDITKLNIVLRNLVINSLKFTPAGGTVTLKQEIKFENSVKDGTQQVAAGFLEVSISDTGIGIDEEQSRKLFSAFSFARNHHSNKIQGSGLGLFICKEIIDMHNADIMVYSAGHDCGTTFTIRLPLFCREQSIINPHEPSPSGTGRVIPFDANEDDVIDRDHVDDIELLESGRLFEDIIPSNYIIQNQDVKILLVDDSLISCVVLKRQIENVLSDFNNKNEKASVTITMADDGTTALEAAKASFLNNEKPFDIIFMDNYMTKMNGPEAAQAMKMIPGFSSFIVGVTGNAMPDQISEYTACGADLVMSKPVHLHQLRNILSRYYYR